MDSLLESIGKLLTVFKDPLVVFLLLLVAAEAYGLAKFVKFLMDRYDGDIKSRSDLATAINGFTKQLEDK